MKFIRQKNNNKTNSIFQIFRYNVKKFKFDKNRGEYMYVIKK